MQKTALIIFVTILVAKISDSECRNSGKTSAQDSSEEDMIVPRHPTISGDKTEHIELSTGKRPETLECEIQGSPTPKAFWLKNGKGLPDDDLEMTNENKFGIVIFKLKFKDDYPQNRIAGNYTCVAANFLGQATRSFVITYENQHSTTPHHKN